MSHGHKSAVTDILNHGRQVDQRNFGPSPSLDHIRTGAVIPKKNMQLSTFKRGSVRGRFSQSVPRLGLNAPLRDIGCRTDVAKGCQAIDLS